MPKKKKLEIVKYNKKVQNRLDLGVKDYKEYSETYSSIEIEIIPRIFINMVNLLILMKMINYIIIYILMIIKKK